MATHKLYPPGLNHISVPLASRRSALAGIALHSPCRPTATAFRWGAWSLVRAFGPAALPGRTASWSPPVEHELWEQVTGDLKKAIGPFDTVAALNARQRSRSAFAVLLVSEGLPVAFVKFRGEADPSLGIEEWALSRLSATPPETFVSPAPLRSGQASDWSYLAIAPLPVALHSMAPVPPLTEVEAEIQDRLAGLERQSEVPSDWVSIHGDLTPWNLRLYPDNRLVLVDWESVGWGPPGADAMLYRVMEAVVRKVDFDIKGVDAAVHRFWVERLQARLDQALQAGDVDVDLAATALSLMKSSAGGPRSG